MHRFSIGNTDTLPGPNNTLTKLRNATIDFYITHYIVENMQLVVGGPQPIEELHQLANRTFGNIKRFVLLSCRLTSIAAIRSVH